MNSRRRNLFPALPSIALALAIFNAAIVQPASNNSQNNSEGSLSSSSNFVAGDSGSNNCDPWCWEEERPSLNWAAMKPLTLKELQTLLVPAYLSKLPEYDGWGNPLEFAVDDPEPGRAESYAIRSLGVDGEPDETVIYEPGSTENPTRDLVVAGEISIVGEPLLVVLPSSPTFAARKTLSDMNSIAMAWDSLGLDFDSYNAVPDTSQSPPADFTIPRNSANAISQSLVEPAEPTDPDFHVSRGSPIGVVQLGHSGSIGSVAFSPNGDFVLTGGEEEDTARLWEVATAREVRQFGGDGDPVLSLAFSPDGRFVFIGGDSVVHQYRATTGREVGRFVGHSGEIKSIVLSRDGRFVLTGSLDGTARLWESGTRQETGQFLGFHLGGVTSVAFSPDGRFALTAGDDDTARLWDCETGEEIRRFEGHEEGVRTAAFSVDGRLVITGDRWTARLWDVSTGREIKRFEINEFETALTSVALSPDGKLLLMGKSDQDVPPGPEGTLIFDVATGEHRGWIPGVGAGPVAFSPDGATAVVCSDDSCVIWDRSTGKVNNRLEGLAWGVPAVAISADASLLLTRAALWGLATGGEVRRWDPPLGGSVAISPNGKLILTTSFEDDYSKVRLLDSTTGHEVLRVRACEDGRHWNEQGTVCPVYLVAFSADGRSFLTGSDDSVRLWETATGREIQRFQTCKKGYVCEVNSVAFSMDGRTVVTGSTYGGAVAWNVETGGEIGRFGGQYKWSHIVDAVAISPDSRFVLTGNEDGALLWEFSTAREVQRFTDQSVNSVAFSPDGRLILTGDIRQVRVWDVSTGDEIRALEGHSAPVESVAFLSKSNDQNADAVDRYWGLSASTDGTVRLWDLSRGHELCKLVSFRDGTWAVVAPDGRFDTNNLEEIKGLHWVMPDHPMRTWPVEIFMRQYYEPRLLPRLLAQENLLELPPLGSLIRARPEVRVAEIVRSRTEEDRIDVSIQVTATTYLGKASGGKDLRLFRDGQMVGWCEGDLFAKTVPAGCDRTIDNKTAKYVFRGIRVPRRQGMKEIEFSAYAFNLHLVKSSTDRKRWAVPDGLAPRRGLAYLITVGVNAYESSDWDLSYAADDARLIDKVLTEKLSTTGQYREIIPVPLISDYQQENGKRIVTESSATKTNFKSVLDLLSGRKVDPQLLKDIPNAQEIGTANPQDLVLISFSSHGYADNKGNFYLFPYDIGGSKPKFIDDDILKATISSDELSLWLRDVDAGDILMIVDACHSAASIEVEGFKPGPMGSRGLGQLAYDKGMRILTASQADDVALESDLIKQGLLTYALVRDGIERGKADFNPKDERITFTEWLGYGVAHVPPLYEEVKAGKLPGKGVVVLLTDEEKSSLKKKNAFQQPALFDFVRNKAEILLEKKP